MPGAVTKSSNANRGESAATDRKLTTYATMAIIAASLGGFTYGVEIGGGAPALQMDSFRDLAGYPRHPDGQCGQETEGDPMWVADQIGWLVGVFNLAALAAAPVAGALADKWGRRFVTILSCLLYIGGAVVEACAGLDGQSSTLITMMYVGRVLTGAGNGFMCMIAPLYGAELAPTRWRGRTVTLFQFMITVGIFVMGIINVEFAKMQAGWRIAFALQAVSAIALLIMSFFMPESPKFYIKQGRHEDALRVLCRLGGCQDDQNDKSRERVIALAELADTKEEVAEAEAAGTIGWSELFTGVGLTPLIVGVGVAALQKISGVNWVLGYFPTIAKQLCIPGFIGTMIVNVVNMVATLVAFPLVDNIGRKALLLWGTVTAIVCFCIVTIMLYVIPDFSVDVGPGYFTLILYCIFQSSFAITWGPMGWLIPAEVFPLHVRGKGMGLATCANMLLDFALQAKLSIVLTSPQVWGVAGTTLFFMCLTTVFALPFVLFLLPETGGVTMEEMRGVLNYKSGGGGETGAGTMSQFVARNWQQTVDIFMCRKADAKLGLIPVDAHLTAVPKDVEGMPKVGSTKGEFL